MAIETFTFDPAMVEKLIRFQSELYSDDRHWIRPFSKEFRFQFSPENSFFRQPGNRHRHFIATNGKHICGQVSALVNGDLKDRDGTPMGAIGFFECVEEFPVAAELLGAATDWLRREHGLRRIWGPINFDIWHGYRLMTRGFGERLFHGEPYNKFYYPAFFEQFGFKVRQRWHSLVLTGRTVLEEVITPWEQLYQRLTAAGCRFETIDMTKRTVLQTVYEVMTRSYKGFLGFTPLTFDEFELLFKGFGPVFDPRFAVLMYDEVGAVAGFAFAYPDHADAIRAMGGKTSFLAKLRFLIGRSSVNRVVFYMIGLTPEEGAKRRGLGKAGYYYILQEILRAGYGEAIVALTAEGNPSRRLVGALMENAQREYSLFELD
jgi:hypothetical protein